MSKLLPYVESCHIFHVDLTREGGFRHWESSAVPLIYSKLELGPKFARNYFNVEGRTTSFLVKSDTNISKGRNVSSLAPRQREKTLPFASSEGNQISYDKPRRVIQEIYMTPAVM